MIDSHHAYDLYDADIAGKYLSLQPLGEGSFGNVRLGMNQLTKQHVAMKYIKVVSRERIIPKAVFREIEALRQLSDNNHNIVRLFDVFAHETEICLVTEYVESDLSFVIKSFENREMPVRFIKAYSNMIIEAVAYCHSKCIIHRDLKPSNILVNKYGYVKLADFGLARSLGRCEGSDADNTDRQTLSHQVATRWYRAPELLFASRCYDYAVDMWAVGAIIGEMFSLQPLFPGTSDIDQIYRVLSVMGTPTSTYWPDAFDLPDYKKIIFPDMKPLSLDVMLPQLTSDDLTFLQLFLKLDPKLRISAAHALSHQHHYFYVARPPMCSVLDLPQVKPSVQLHD